MSRHTTAGLRVPNGYRAKIERAEQETACAWCGGPLLVGDRCYLTHDDDGLIACTWSCLRRDQAEKERRYRLRLARETARFEAEQARRVSDQAEREASPDDGPPSAAGFDYSNPFGGA
jgi:hypothetical protein